MRMHRCLLLVFGCAAVAGGPSLAAAQSLSWATRAGGLDIEAGHAVAVDSDGNSHVTGIFSKSVQCRTCGRGATFGAGQPNQTTLTGVEGSQDLFVAKYDAAGALLWARGAGGADADYAWSIALDPAGNSYVTGTLGSFTNVANFGNGVTLSPAGDGNWSFVFVVKYDSSGNAVWAQNLGLTGFNGIASAIAVDASGTSCVTGSSPDPTSGGGLVKLWKLDPNGAILWARQPTGIYGGGGTGISVDTTGNCYVTGVIASGTATFGPGEPNETIITDVNGEAGEMFVAKYDPSGILAWARQSPDIPGSVVRATGIATDRESNSYVVGYGAAFLGGLATSLHDAFVVKYDALGVLIWAELISGNGSPAVGNAVALNATGDPYVTGGFTTSVTFASGDANQTTLLSLGGFFGGDIFVARYTQDGFLVWVKQAGGSTVDGGAEEIGLGISVDGGGSAFVTGVFSGRTTFGTGEANETALSSADGLDRDVFVAKYANDEVVPNRPPVAADQAVLTAEDTAAAITLMADDPDGDTLTYSIVTGPSHGSLSGTPPALTYTPHLNYHGADAFTFRATDGSLASNVATVTMTVTPVNDAPIAHNQVLATAEDTPVGIILTGQDVEADPLTFIVVSGPSHGTLVGTPPHLLYTPQLDYIGPDSLTFRASDGTTASSAATVAITVGARALACGTLTSGTIAVPGEVDRFTFGGHAGQIISLAVVSTGGFGTSPSNTSVSLTLVAPSGRDVGSTLRSNSEGTFTLPERGTYTMVVRAARLSTVGSYNLNLECLFPTPSPDAVPLQCGSLESGRLDTAGEVDLFTFSGHAGQIISLALVSTGGFSASQSNSSAALTLIAPSGIDVGSVLRSNSQRTFTLPQTGTYAIAVHAVRLSSVGSYNVNVECLFPAPSPDAVSLQCGSFAPGRLDFPGEIDLFTFSGQSGQIVSLALTSTGGFSGSASNTSVALSLVDSSGADIGAPLRSNKQRAFTLPLSGSYAIRVYAVNLATTGTYTLRVTCGLT